MFNAQMELLSTLLTAVVHAADSGEPTAGGWSAAQAAARECGELEADLARVLAESDLETLRKILAAWTQGTRHLPLHDREVLKRAMKAFRKRLKVTLLDDESSLGGGPMSSGRGSSIVAITPPDRYPTAVWAELVRRGQLRDARHGMYELPPG